MATYTMTNSNGDKVTFEVTEYSNTRYRVTAKTLYLKSRGSGNHPVSWQLLWNDDGGSTYPKGFGTSSTVGSSAKTFDLSQELSDNVREYDRGSGVTLHLIFKIMSPTPLPSNVTKTVSVPAATYSVTYNGNGNTGGSTSSQTKTYGTALTLRSNGFTRTGYAFKRWNTTSSDSGTAYNAGASYTANAALALYAIWNPYIYYNANGGVATSMPDTQLKTYGSTLRLTSGVTPTRAGYAFKRWNTATDDSGTAYTPGQTLAANDNTTKTLYAIWNPLISYDANGGSGAPATAAKTYGEAFTVSTTTPTRTGYTFAGWNTAVNGSGTAYASGGTIPASMNVATTLYAQWTKVANAPTISSLTAVRSNSSGTADDNGTCCKVTARWSVDTTNASGNTGTVTGTIKPEGGSASAITWTSGTSGTSDTATALISGLDTDKQYTITVTVTDTAGTSGRTNATSRSDIMTRAFFIMDLKAGGNAMGIGTAAPSAGFEVGWESQFDEDVTMLEDLAVGGALAVTGDLTAPQLTANAVTADVATAASGWTLNSQTAITMHKLVMVSLDLTPAADKAADVNCGTICTLKSGYRPRATQGFACYQGHGYVGTGGAVSLHTTAAITTSAHVYVGLMFLKS